MVKARALALLLPALFAAGLHDAEAGARMRRIELALPRAAAADEEIGIAIETGPLRKGSEIAVTTASGKAIGTISPFAIRAGEAAGTYTFPLEPGMIQDGHVTIELSVTRFGASPRAPTRREVPKVQIVFTRTAR